MKRKATAALCSTKDQDYELDASSTQAISATKKARAASSTEPINRRKQPVKKLATNQTSQMQYEQQQQEQDGPVWIYGLINNIEQMLTQFNNKQRMQQVVQQQQQQQQDAVLLKQQSANSKPSQQMKTNSKSKARSSARSSGYSTPSSLYSSAPLSPPFSSPSSSSSSSSSCAYGSSSSSNSPVSAGSLAPAISKKSGTELLTTNNNQVPRSPISRQIKFHEYKGPPQARKPSIKQQQPQQEKSTDKASNALPSATSSSQTAPASIRNQLRTSDPDCVRLPPIVAPPTWQNGHVATVAVPPRASSQLAAQHVNPTQLQAVQVRGINVAAAKIHNQMGSTPSDNSASQSLSAQHQYQPQIGTQLTQNHHAHGPILMAASNMQRQQERQQNYRPKIQCRQHQQRHQAHAHQQIVQMPVSCQLIQQHQLRQQQQQQQQRRLFSNQPVSIQLVHEGHQAFCSNQQQVFVVDQAAFHHIQQQQQQRQQQQQQHHQQPQQQQQQQQQQQRPKSVTVVLHQQQFHHNQQQQQNVHVPVRCADVNNNYNQFPNQQFGPETYAISQPEIDSVSMRDIEFGTTDVKNSERTTATGSEQYEQAQSEQPQLEEYKAKVELPPSSCYEAAPFQDLAHSIDCDYQNTCDDLEPTISFDNDLVAGTSSGGQPFDDTLLFSEFIDLQDIPLNVDESDWLRKFLPPCSTL